MKRPSFRPTVAAWLIVTTLGTPYAYAAITHDWPADGDATDTVGDADGTLVGGTSFGPGLFGQAFVFDGVDSSVAFGTSAGNFGTSDFTIAFVIQSTNTTNVEGVLGKREVCGFSSFWDVRSSSSGTLSLEVYENNVNTGLATTSVVNDGLFHTVVFTREGTVVSAYVDGFLRWQADTGFKANVTNNAALTAGTSACTGVDGTVRFTGVLDEIRIADTADPTLLPPVFHCADATRSGDVSAADALAALRAAVALETCDLCLCDINGSGSVTAPDALAILQRAVSLPVTPLCPLCPVEL